MVEQVIWHDGNNMKLKVAEISDIREIEHERRLLNCQEQGPLKIPIKRKYRTQLGQQIMLVFHGPNNFFYIKKI
jgi:hypothetical protein